MEKSIESIWKEGFLKRDALVAPKINDLYNRKSMDIIDRMVRLVRWNMIGMISFAAIDGIYFTWMGAPVWLIRFVSILFLLPAYYCWRQLRVMHSMDRSVSSYEYLKNFDAYLGIERAFLEHTEQNIRYPASRPFRCGRRAVPAGVPAG
jgi:hypothetical protein